MKKHLLSILIISLLVCGCEKKNEIINNNKDEIITQKYEGKISKENDFTFMLDVKDKNQGDEVTYKLNDDYTIKLNFVINEYNEKSFNIYVNDSLILNDTAFEEYIRFYTLSDSLIYINSGYTDIRCERIYIINNKQVTELYELDNINGMVPSEIKINKDSIVINASRISHGPSIIYGTKEITIDDKNAQKEAGITENTIIEATYTYTIKNNKLNITPTITNKVSLKNYEY